MGSLTDRVVTRLSSLIAGGGGGGNFIRTGFSYDYAIGGIPFLSGAGQSRPMRRQTADYRKQQIDQSAEPGEQSLVFWWLRSQLSFHAGTGLTYEDPDQAYPQNAFRFADSLGVDPWTLGQVKLLQATYVNRTATNPVLVRGCVDSAGPTDIYLQAETTTLRRCTDGASTAVTWGGAGNILALADDGTNYYAADATGIYKGTLAGGVGAKIWNTGNANVALGWVKQRLMVGIGPSIYDLSPAGTGGPVLPTTPKYTHPNPNWRWTSISETPASVLAAGFVGGQSAVYRFDLSTAGDVPTLNAGVIAMQFPQGEQVYCLYTYLGDYMAIGTSKGVRIASVADDGSGNLQWGPLSVTSTQPVRSITARDRFVYAACTNQLNGSSGLWRIDMGTQVAFRKFASANDLQTHAAGTVRSVDQFGSSGRLVVAVDGSGSYLEDMSNVEPTGYLTTGRIRFHTLEPKIYKYVQPRIAQALTGSLNVQVVDQSGATTNVATWGSAGATELDQAAVSSTIGTQEYVSLQFTFTRDGVNTNSGPVFSGYQLKALPATKRQRSLLLPLMCFDFEADRYDATSGGEGSAITRLEALETLEAAGDLVLFQDLSRDPAENRLVAIDQIDFVQDVPPKNASGWGGYAMVTLRTVA